MPPLTSSHPLLISHVRYPNLLLVIIIRVAVAAVVVLLVVVSYLVHHPRQHDGVDCHYGGMNNVKMHRIISIGKEVKLGGVPLTKRTRKDKR